MFIAHKLFLTIVLLALASLSGAGAAGGRSELVFNAHKLPSDGVLLARHAPLLSLHPAERFGPVAVESYLDDAPLAGGRYDVTGCSARDGLAALDCYDAVDEGARTVVYGAAFHSRGRTALQYWLFSAFNLWSPTVPQSADFWQAHEADWEAVTVLLDERARPVELGLSRHCGGARRAWARVEKRGSRPVVYPALGSHANYFGPGSFRLEPRCWPSEAVAIYKAYGVAMLDHAARAPLVAPAVARVTRLAPAWMSFAGAWGEEQFAGFPGNVFRFGTSPRGPVFHALWREPFRTPAGWPRG